MKTALLIVLLGVSSCYAATKCCKGQQNYLSSKKTCIDGSHVDLNCQLFFAVNNTPTEFYIDEDENIVYEGDDEKILPNRYCYANYTHSQDVFYYICVDPDPPAETAKTLLNTILQLISIFFILMTVTIYLSIPELQDLQGIIIIHSISGLGMGFIFMSSLQLSGYISDRACHVIAYSMYFSLLYAFFWLNVLCFHIWKQVVRLKFLSNISNWRNIYHVYGIGGPVLCVALVIFVNHAEIPELERIHPGIGDGKCWFKSKRETFIYFYGPIAILIFENIIYFIWTASILWRQMNKNACTKVLNYRLRLYSKLFIVMGITWLFEVMSAALEEKRGFSKWIWIVPDIINALEGVLIFLFLVTFRKKVKRYLAKKKCCKLQFPARWRTEHDSECDPIEEDISLPMVYDENNATNNSTILPN